MQQKYVSSAHISIMLNGINTVTKLFQKKFDTLADFRSDVDVLIDTVQLNRQKSQASIAVSWVPITYLRIILLFKVRFSKR